jgi:hypothetical protein
MKWLLLLLPLVAANEVKYQTIFNPSDCTKLLNHGDMVRVQVRVSLGEEPHHNLSDSRVESFTVGDGK